MKVFDQADEETRSSLIFLLALQKIYEGTSKFTEEEIDEIDLEAPDLIPNCIAAILLVSRPALVMKAGQRLPRAQPVQAPWPKLSLSVWFGTEIQAVLREKLTSTAPSFGLPARISGTIGIRTIVKMVSVLLSCAPRRVWETIRVRRIAHR